MLRAQFFECFGSGTVHFPHQLATIIKSTSYNLRFLSCVSPDDDGTLGLHYKGFGVLAVGAIQELKAEKDKQIGALSAENAQLRERLAKLEKAVSALSE